MEATSGSSIQLSSKPKPPRIRDRHRRHRSNHNESSNGPTSTTDPPNGQDDAGGQARGFTKNPMTRRLHGQTPDRVANLPMASGSRHTAANDTPDSSSTIPNGGRRQPNYRNPSKRIDNDNATSVNPDRAPQSGRRGVKFNTSLTEPSADAAISPVPPKRSYKFKNSASNGDDLTSTLTRALSTPPYPDCPICFAPIHPNQPTWSCSPPCASHMSEADGKDNEHLQCCWTTFHLKCIRSWAGKSVKEVADAWRARGEDRAGEWRCPGCQFKREFVPNGYW